MLYIPPRKYLFYSTDGADVVFSVKCEWNLIRVGGGGGERRALCIQNKQMPTPPLKPAGTSE